MTNKSEHTPGPWRIHKNIGRKSALGIVADAAPCIIAVMGNQKDWPSEAVANAALIAAAPDLLKALGMCVKDLEMWPGAKNPEGFESMKLARNVIAKAEGRI